MSKEISTRISPEGLEIANAYLQLGSVQLVSAQLNIDEAEVSEFLGKREVKAYVDQVFLDTGYRNRFKLGKNSRGLVLRNSSKEPASGIPINIIRKLAIIG